MSEGDASARRQNRVEELGRWLNAADAADYRAAREAAQRMRLILSQEIAARVEPSFNAEIAAMPQGTYDDKKALSKWINHELRELGLTVACPKTGLSVYLTGNTGNDRQVGRFLFHALQADGQRFASHSTAQLPWLRLIPALGMGSRPPWIESVGKRGAGDGPDR